MAAPVAAHVQGAALTGRGHRAAQGSPRPELIARARADVDLPTGFIWKKGEAGQGSFRASAAGLSVEFNKTNFIYYQYDWSNAA